MNEEVFTNPDMKKELDVLTEVNNFLERFEDNFSEDSEDFKRKWIAKNNEEFFLRNKEAYISYLVAANVELNYRNAIFTDEELAEMYLNNFYIKKYLDPEKWNATAVNIIVGLGLFSKLLPLTTSDKGAVEFFNKLLNTVKMLFNENEVEYMAALENNSLIVVNELD